MFRFMLTRLCDVAFYAYHGRKTLNQVYAVSGWIFCSHQNDQCDIFDLPVLISEHKTDPLFSSSMQQAHKKVN
jgi:hypothetical protein